MLRVFYTNVCDVDGDISSVPLSKYRVEKLSRTKRDDLKMQGTGAELLLIYSLRAICPDISLPLDIAINEKGKPYLRSGAVFFNLSHSGEYAVCAVSDSPVGIDIQKPSSYNRKLSERFFCADEQLWLENCDAADEEFTRLWTLKESYIKAVGDGLRLPLNSFSVISGDGTGDWTLIHSRLDNYHVSVCTKEKIESFNCEIIKLL